MICLTLKCVESQCICSVKLILVDACCAVRKYRNKGEAPSTTLMYFPTVFQRDYSQFNFLLILAVPHVFEKFLRRLTLSSSPNYKLLTDERKTQRATHIREGSSRNDSDWFLAAVERGKGFEANYTRTEFQGRWLAGMGPPLVDDQKERHNIDVISKVRQGTLCIIRFVNLMIA